MLPNGSGISGPLGRFWMGPSARREYVRFEVKLASVLFLEKVPRVRLAPGQAYPHASPEKRLILRNEISVGCRIDRDSLLNQPEKQHPAVGRVPAVEAKGEFIEIVVNMSSGYPPLVDSH